ncbi:MAG: copper resistance protein CopA [Rhodospirillales bacterium]|jgi:CopA family copper-resistance protein|nr:copper resistance protein CopA [Rhodospirillales bacterium]
MTRRSISPVGVSGGLTRRRFVQGTAAAGVLAYSGWPPRTALAVGREQVLSGSHFDLEIGATPVNITGRPATATAVNGSVPAPILRWREGETVTLAVTNRLSEPSSIHWHGVRSPSVMDGVPGLSFAGIAPGETYVYRIPLHQSGTYWYHSHSGFQEQTGLYGALIIEPRAGYSENFDRDYVVLLSDWSDEDPHTIASNLKFQSDYYNYGQRTAGTFLADVKSKGLAATISDRLEWGKMRMSPTDILDVTGATYTYLLNGQAPAANWTALFRPGERIRLRFINASSMSIFDVRIPGLPMTVIQADGNDVRPVTVDEFRISIAETYDVIVNPEDDRAFTIFAQSEDRSGFARGTLAPRPGLAAAVPPMDPRPIRTMADMGMGSMEMGGMDMTKGSMPGMKMDGMGSMPMDHSAMPGMEMGESQGGKPAVSGPASAGELKRSVAVDNVAMMPTERLAEPGEGLGNGRRALTYADLRATKRGADPRPPSREITLHLTGNMERFMWGFDGKKFSESGPIRLERGERVRFVLINDTMMDHPIHLHGLWSELDNGQAEFRPYKHTINVKPGEKLSYLVTADEPGRWAYHCHLLYHMEMGMFREVRVP